MRKKYAIGTDIGGSHISCAVMDIEQKTLLKSTLHTGKVDNQAGASEILAQWQQVLQKTMDEVKVDELAGIGFAMPGPFNYPKGIAMFEKVAKFESLYAVDVAKELAGRLSLVPEQFRFLNDASAFAIGESWIGKAVKAERSVSITLGTGFGSAFIENGLPVVEGKTVPEMGCVWHLSFQDGIADDYFSTRWFVKKAKEMLDLDVSGVKEIAEQAGHDPKAKEIFTTFGSNLGKFLGPWLKKFDAEVLVLGGNVPGAYHLFGEAFEEALKQRGAETRIVISELKEEAALVGSARMFQPDYWDRIKPLLSKM